MNLTLRYLDSDRTELLISDEADFVAFSRVTSIAQHQLGGVWAARLDSSEARYWDLRVGDAWVTFHMETFLRLSVFPTKDVPNPLATITNGAKRASQSSPKAAATFKP